MCIGILLGGGAFESHTGMSVSFHTTDNSLKILFSLFFFFIDISVCFGCLILVQRYRIRKPRFGQVLGNAKPGDIFMGLICINKSEWVGGGIFLEMEGIPALGIGVFPYSYR